MSDLTVLVSPTPLYPKQNPLGFNLARRSQNDPNNRPVMVTLESVDTDEDGPRSPVEVSNLNVALLSPPKRTFRASQPPPPQRPASAPPFTVFPTPSEESLSTPPIAHVPRRVFSSSLPTDKSELSRPPPPLFRPTTFWRRTRRSGVTGASYSPSSHLIRRSTYIAAGLSLDRPEADLSALCVESREIMVYIRSTGAANWYRINQAIPPTQDFRRPFYAAGDSPALLMDTSDAVPEGATNVQNAFPTDLSTVSLIQITALPPATALPQPVLPKLPYHRRLNVLYLVPLFIALGIVLGAIAAVILLNWQERRRRLLRTSTLLPGPPYMPPENDVEDRLVVDGYPSMEHVSLFAAATPSKFTVHGSRYIPKRTFAWQALDSGRPPYSRPTHTQTIVSSSDGEKFTVVTEEDPFLPSSPMVPGPSLESSNDLSVPRIRVSPSLADPASGDKLNQASLPKSFRRSMFDVLKLNYRSVPRAPKEPTVPASDGGYVDIVATNEVRRVSSAAVAGERRFRRRSLEGDLHIGDMEDVLGLLELEDEKQDVTNTPMVLSKKTHPLKGSEPSSFIQDVKPKQPRRVTPFASSPGETKITTDGETEKKRKHSDIYTKAPQRRHSRTSHAQSSTGGSSSWSSAADTHASILPLSPPSLMSPPLEKSLFFTSSLSSSVSLANCVNNPAATHSLLPDHGDRSPELSLFPLPSGKTKATKKLRTRRPEPLLPYPSYPDLAHPQATPRERSTSVNAKLQLASPGSPKPKGRSTSAAQRGSTGGIWSLGSLSQTSLAIALASSSSADMLDKVNDIVAMGYSKKLTSVGGADGEVEARLGGI